ncbi:glycosyl hydrolase [Aggregatimonas sangjinii]|nr:glycosyl hydrolase [Aggregatimonas sangjinii]
MKRIFQILLAFCFISVGHSQNSEGSGTMESNFKNPPNSTKPKTWMHAMSGNMSKAGMTKDLEAIAAAGQGGVLLFNIANKIPYGDTPYNSEKHHQIITHAAQECERLNLSFGVHNCDGWTSSGGPWIKPEQSMKMVVWSETVVDGGEIETELSQPTTNEGFYKDIAVLAYPAHTSEIIDAQVEPTITASDENFDIETASDGLNGESTALNAKSNEKPWILFDYGKEHTIRSVYASYIGNDLSATLETSDDGQNFSLVKSFARPTRIGKKKRIFSESFDPITARYFRMSFEKETDIREIDMRATRFFKNYLGYSGLGSPGSYLDIAQGQDSSTIIDKKSIIDLTGSMSENGVLKGKLPKGKWTVLRFGYTSTAAKNWPASKWGIGLECDKFSRPALKQHFDAFSKRVIDNARESAPNALQYIEIDSYEMGGQNWTDDFATLFRGEKGYDILPFLPVYAGRIVESVDAVSGFSFDINEVYCDLMTKNYFDYFTELCNENGLKSYVEPYGAGPVSTLDISKNVDLPMTEFWMNRPRQKRLTGTIDGAHIYGKNIISAEAFTTKPDLNWKMHPALAKKSGDMAWVAGVNEFMFHRFVHQANLNVKPGLTMGTWGAHIDRTQAWWMNAGKAWFEYISRGSYLLRQGHPVADVLVFVGDRPHTDGFKRDELGIEIPVGLNYDCTNTDALINRMTIENGKLKLPEGNAYGYLVLKDMQLTKLSTLHRIKEIAEAGIQVIGGKPKKLAGYQVTDQQQQEFENLIAEIWGMPNSSATFDFTQVQSDFAVEGLEKEFIHRKSEEADIYFFYNDKEETVSYESVFRVANKIPEVWNPHTGQTTKLARFKSEKNGTRVWLDLQPLESAFIVFRETADAVDPVISVSGESNLFLNEDNKIIYIGEKEGTHSLTLASGEKVNLKLKSNRDTIDLNSSWEVEFLKEYNYPAKTPFKTLLDWKEHENDSIRFYSGTAIYRKSVAIPKKLKDGDRAVLHLGEVKIAAEVIVNGKSAGVLWMAPFTLDISKYLQKGDNNLEIRVTNLWTNRLIGDEHFPEQADGYRLSGYIPSDSSKMPDWYINNEPMPEGPRTTFDSGQFYKKDDSLMPSGLLGPVSISFKQEQKIQL